VNGYPDSKLSVLSIPSSAITWKLNVMTTLTS